MNEAAGLLRQELNELDYKKANYVDASLVKLNYEHLFQSLCQRFPDEIPFVDVAYTVNLGTNNKAQLNGGVMFITAD